MVQRVLVTGGAGFIGSNTVALLLQEGMQVVVLDNLSTGKLSNLELDHPNLEFVEGDILEFPLVEDLIKGCDAVLHLAAIASVPKSVEHPIYTFQVNTQGFLHVIQAVKKSGRAIRLVHASSAAVYGEAQALPCDDTRHDEVEPLSPYALHKKHNEDFAVLYEHLHGIKSLGLRYFNVYGPNQDPSSPYSGVISLFLDAYTNKQPMKIFGDGKQSRDFIYVEDVARANLLALQSDVSGAMNIATGKAQTLLQLIDCIEAAGEYPAERQFLEARVGDIVESYATTVTAKEKLAFEANVSLQDGIAQMVKAIGVGSAT